MTSPRATGSAPEAGDSERRLVAFDRAWQGSAPPRIEDFWQGTGLPVRFLEELVKIDLEYRWRRGGGPLGLPARPRLEDYAARYPELRLSVALVGEEYHVRQRWGDRPTHAEYISRFPALGPELRKVLEQVDARLATEFKPLPPGGAALVEKPPPPPAILVQALPAPTSVAALGDALRRLQLLSTVQLEELTRELLPRFPDPRALAKELLQRGWLTPFQINQVLQGRANELLVGPHVLLERLGEGGTGQVFKARHLHMNRVVAVKLIRKELLTDAEVVARFQREVQVVSQLTSLHVVHAYDAGPSPSGYYLAMEYVEGADLMRLVKQRGPLPVEDACNYTRQAALGLQHIHERDLVHRDIKPSNLILAGGKVSGGVVSGGVVSGGSTTHHSPLTTHQVKILDLGLARLQRPVDEASGALTGAGAALVGTLDYMAPEQALDFHAVDQRADIYSLGCTFYYLLTGKAPFAGGTVAQKVLRQQHSDPTPVEQLRRDVPTAVASVVRRMMARQPAERFQSAAEVIQALPNPAAPLAVLLPPTGCTLALPMPSAVPVSPAAVPFWRKLPRRKTILAAGALVVLCLVLWALFRPTTPAERETYLSDMQESDVVVSKASTFGKNGKALIDGKPRLVIVGGIPSPKGLYMEPEYNTAAHVSYRLGKKYRRFEAAAAPNDSHSFGHVFALFTVVGDGKTLWRSDKVPNGKPQKCDIDVTGVEVLELFATGGGHPVWIEPKVIK